MHAQSGKLSLRSNLDLLNFPADEQSLAQTIERFQLSGFPLTNGRVCELAYQYAHVNGIEGFSNETQLAG